MAHALKATRVDGRNAWLLTTGAVATAALVLLAPSLGEAGGAIGWASSMEEWASEAESVGQAALLLGILSVGASLMFGLHQLLLITIPFTAGGAVMANLSGIASIFGASGGGGGSLLDSTFADALLVVA